MKKIKKVFFIFISLIVFMITSCDKNKIYKINYVSSYGELVDAIKEYDGSTDIELPILENSLYDFVGWYDNAEYSGSTINTIYKGQTGDKTFYAKWVEKTHTHEFIKSICSCGEIDPNYASDNNLNPIAYNGNAMTFGIMVKDKSSVDPFDSNYKGLNQVLEQSHQKAVETAYNIKISYVEFDNSVSMGNEHVDYIKTGYLNNTFKKNNIFVLETSSDYITTLSDASCLAPLYDIYSETGYFVDYSYQQNGWINLVTSKGSAVYGYNTNSIYPDTYLCYNVTKVKELFMEDPVEMWFKGEWTWDNFDKWIKSSSELLEVSEFAVDVRYEDFFIGASASQGSNLVNYQRSETLLNKIVPCAVANNMKSYYQNSYLNNNRGSDEISDLFIQGASLLHNGSNNVLKELNNNHDLNFEVGIVPYPLKNDSIVTVYTDPYTYVDPLGNTISVTEPLKNRYNEPITKDNGESIYGIDLSKSYFRTPVTTIDCYGLLNYPGDGINGLDTSIAFSILHDLKSKNGLTKVNITTNNVQVNTLDEEVIKSITSKVYYDSINRVSFNTAYYEGSQYLLSIAINDIISSDKDSYEVLDEINNKYNEVNYSIIG